MNLVKKRNQLKEKAQAAWEVLRSIKDVNSEEYARALAKYDKIVDTEISVLERLGYPDSNPCPLKRKDLPCSDCSGWYMPQDSRGGKQSAEGEGEKCVLKDISGEGEDLIIMSKLIR